MVQKRHPQVLRGGELTRAKGRRGRAPGPGRTGGREEGAKPENPGTGRSSTRSGCCRGIFAAGHGSGSLPPIPGTGAVPAAAAPAARMRKGRPAPGGGCAGRDPAGAGKREKIRRPEAPAGRVRRGRGGRARDADPAATGNPQTGRHSGNMQRPSSRVKPGRGTGIPGRRAAPGGCGAAAPR